MGWGDDESPEDETSGFTEVDFYEKIQSSLTPSNWTVAISNLELLESQFPFKSLILNFTNIFSQIELLVTQLTFMELQINF